MHGFIKQMNNICGVNAEPGGSKDDERGEEPRLSSFKLTPYFSRKREMTHCTISTGGNESCSLSCDLSSMLV